MAELHVAVDGTVTTTASITQGGNTANVAVPGPNLGAALQVATGVLVSSTTLSAQSATGAGTVADFGAARQQITLAIATSAGVSAGAVALEVSQDNSTWFRATPVTTATASTVFQVTQAGAWRYARGNVTTTITGGTVTATLMGA